MKLTYTSKRNHRPDILGPNLVVNPGVFNNTTGWTAGSSATLSAVEGRLRVARNAVNNPSANQTVTVEINELYLLEASHLYVSGTQVAYEIYSNSILQHATGYVTNGSISAYIFAPATAVEIRLYCYTSTGAEYSEFSSVKLRKVTTLGHGERQLIRSPFLSTAYANNSTQPWTATNSALSISGNKLRVTNSGAIAGEANQIIPTIPGATYKISFLYTEGTATSGVFYAQDYYAGTNLQLVTATTTATTYTGSFVAAGTKTSISLINSTELNAYNEYSVITVTQADSQYRLEKIVSVLELVDDAQVEQTKTESGRTYTLIKSENEEVWDITTDVIETTELDDWREFHHSVKGGETFTLDAYQNPQLELISNGTFDSATTGWIGTNATLSVASRRLRVTNTAANGRASIPFATIAGETYEFFVDYVAGTAAAAQVYVGATLGGFEVLVNGMAASKTYTGTFVALSATSYFHVSTVDPTVGDYADFDNISVRSIATLNPQVCELVPGSFKTPRIASTYRYRASFKARLSR